jgi:hypothetical protein
VAVHHDGGVVIRRIGWLGRLSDAKIEGELVGRVPDAQKVRVGTSEFLRRHLDLELNLTMVLRLLHAADHTA